MAVVPGYRASGWGRQLLERLLHEAEKQDLRDIELTVGLSNIAAVRLYESTGFSTVLSDGRSARMRWTADAQE
jgi:ribosomal protein S18 acetylase RimI-like enzyme